MKSLEALRDKMAIASRTCGAICIATMLLVLLAQIAGRIVGYRLPGAEDFVSWSMAGAILLPLADTFVAGGHIRLDLVRSRSANTQSVKLLDLAVLVFAIALVGTLLFAATRFVITSYTLDDTSPGLIAVALWIPQLSLLVGVSMFLLVLVIRLVENISSGMITRIAGEEFEQ